MEVEDAEKVIPKIKADDDPENEGAYMRLSLLRFRMTRCVPRRLGLIAAIECGRWCRHSSLAWRAGDYQDASVGV